MQVDVLCTIDWRNTKISGRTVNLSCGGALIATREHIVPPRGTPVNVRFHLEQDASPTEEVLSSKIIHTALEIVEKGTLGFFGVRFEEPVQNIKKMLGSVFDAPASDQLAS